MAGPTTIERTRLLAPMQHHRAVVLVAPGGYGKTTTADQLLALWGLAAVVVRLRAETTEIDLIEAIKRGARRAGLADLADASVAADPLTAADELIAAAAARPESFALLVDDVQLLTPSAWALLDGLVADLPRACRAICCGRAMPGPVVAIRDSYVADAQELRMTASEVGEILGPLATPALVADLTGATDGWPAAIAIGHQRVRSDPHWSPSTKAAGVGLLAGMIDPLLGDEREAWLRLARVPLLDPRVAELVAGPGAFDRVLRSALPSRTDRGHWTVVPDAVRDALMAISTGEGRIDIAILRLVAEHYADRGELVAAVHLLTPTGDAAAVATLLAGRHWTDLESIGLTQLRQLIDTIPDPVLAVNAMILVDAARAAEAHRPALRRHWLAQLDGLEPVEPRVRHAGNAERARDLVRLVRLDDAIALGEAVVAAASPGELVTLGRAKLAIAHAHAFRSNEAAYDIAERRFEEAADLFGLAGEHRLQAEALARLGYNVLFHQGKPAAGAARLELAVALLPSGDRTRANWLTSYADVLDWLGQDAAADAAINEAIEIGQRLRDHGVLGFAHWTRAWTLGRRGDVAAMRAEVAEVERLRPGWLDSPNAVEFYGSIADHCVALGDAEGLAHCRSLAEELGARMDYPQAVAMMTARIDALAGDAGAALASLALLDSADGAAVNSRWVRRLEAAVASLRLGDRDGARAFAAEAIAMCEAMGLPDLPRRFERPLVETLAPVWPAAGVEVVSDLTTITLLGTFAVRTDHRDVTPPAGHPSTLLKLLVLRGSMTVDSVIDQLWPDADVDTGRARLRNTMNRLRTKSGVLVERRGETLELVATARPDVHVFEHAAAEALGAEASMRIGLARGAIALYTGELLPGDTYEDWAAAPRERLVRRYLALIDLVAEAAEREGNRDEAARLLDLGIGADALDESRYVRLAEVLAEQGRTTAARQVAERGLAVFAELGVPPSAALLRLCG